MIVILSQNKEVIKKCKDIQVDGVKVADWVDETVGTCVLLGTYATEERAKEIVGEIWDSIRFGDKYFIMPTE